MGAVPMSRQGPRGTEIAIDPSRCAVAMGPLIVLLAGMLLAAACGSTAPTPFTAAPVLSAAPVASTVSPTAAERAAPATPGTITVSKTVSVPRGGSAVTLGTYTFTEGAAGDWAANQWVRVCLAGVAGSTSALSLAGGTVNGPDALGLTASGAGLSVGGALGVGCFEVTIGTSSSTYRESFSVSDLRIKADTRAMPGTITAAYTTDFGNDTAYFGGSSATAVGTLAAASAPGTQLVVVTQEAGSPAFVPGALAVAGAHPESVPVAPVAATGMCATSGGTVALGPSQECLHVAFSVAHAANDAVSESITGQIGSAPSPGVIGDAMAP